MLAVFGRLTFLPRSKGMYLCLIMCFTCRFIVMKNSTKKYSSSIGQKTGTSKIGKNVASMPKRNDLDEEYLQVLKYF